MYMCVCVCWSLNIHVFKQAFNIIHQLQQLFSQFLFLLDSCSVILLFSIIPFALPFFLFRSRLQDELRNSLTALCLVRVVVVYAEFARVRMHTRSLIPCRVLFPSPFLFLFSPPLSLSLSLIPTR